MSGAWPADSTRCIYHGKGSEPALFLHCSLASGKSLVPVMEAVGDRLTSTAIDLPGHGGSSDWDGQGDYLARATAIAASFAHGGVHLFGHSLGGVVAVALAVEHPHLVRSLTLVEPVLFAAAKGTPAHEDYLSRQAPFTEAMEAGDREAATRHFTAMWGDGQAWENTPEPVRRVMQERIHLVAATGPGLNDDTMEVLGEGRLEAVEAPVLLVSGEDTHPVVPAILDTLEARLPDARRAVVSGASHMAPLTHPDEVARLIRGLVS